MKIIIYLFFVLNSKQYSHVLATLLSMVWNIYGFPFEILERSFFVQIITMGKRDQFDTALEGFVGVYHVSTWLCLFGLQKKASYI